MLAGGKCLYSSNELSYRLDLDGLGMCVGELSIAKRHVEVVDAVHPGEKGLVDQPLIGNADLGYIECFGVQLVSENETIIPR